jgi:DNA polymerase epsilon subunit 1
MTEAEYQENSKGLSGFLNHSDVEGVYESKVSLMFKLVLEVGCVFKIQGANQTNREKNEYDLKQLVYRTTADCPYLENFTATKIYLYHSQMDGKAVFGLFMPHANEAIVVAVNPNQGQVENVSMKSLFRKCVRATKPDEDKPEVRSRLLTY